MSASVTYRMWLEIQDVIGNASLWPRCIRRLFWKKNLRHFERVLVGTFIWVNGLNPDVFIEWAFRIGCLVPNSSGYRHFVGFLRTVENGRRYKLYSWNIAMGCYQDLAGNIVIYGK